MEKDRDKNIQQRRKCNSKCTEVDLSSQRRGQVDLAKLLRAFTILAEKDALVLIISTSLFYFGVTALWASTGSYYSGIYNLSTLEAGFAFL